jgi:type IV pilus assembly protein PilC
MSLTQSDRPKGLRKKRTTPAHGSKQPAKRFSITLPKYEAKIPKRDIINTLRQLGVFLRAGVSVPEALVVIAEESPSKGMATILREMAESLRTGTTVSAAAAAHPNVFPRYVIGVLDSAELTGELDRVLDQVASSMERDVAAKGQVTKAITYPAIVLGMSIMTVVVLTTFVLPRFVVFFASLHAKLPLTTRILLSSSHVFSQLWPILGLLVAFLALGGLIGFKTPRGRAIVDTVVLRIPVLGEFMRTAVLERVCRILAAVVRAGVDLPRAMTVTADAANSAPYRAALEEIRDDVMRGEGLSGPISRSRLFPGTARQMIRVGEETGTLDAQLDVAAEFYKGELEVRLERLTSLMEPAIIIFMGVVVGFVALALIQAMYGIYSQVKA